MSDANNWVNELRGTARDFVLLMVKIDELSAEAQRNAKAYNLREPGNPDDSIGDKVRHWLTATGAAGTFPNPDASDLWAAALVLYNFSNTAVTEGDSELLTWVAQ